MEGWATFLESSYTYVGSNSVKTSLTLQSCVRQLYQRVYSEFKEYENRQKFSLRLSRHSYISDDVIALAADVCQQVCK